MFIETTLHNSKLKVVNLQAVAKGARAGHQRPSSMCPGWAVLSSSPAWEITSANRKNSSALVYFSKAKGRTFAKDLLLYVQFVYLLH